MDVADFVDEQFFSSYILTFMQKFGHYDDTIDYNYKRPRPRNCYEYCSKIQRAGVKKEKMGYTLHGELAWLQNYCTTLSDERKLYPVVFAAWWGLSKKECLLIGDCNRPKYADYILNAFLCGKSYTEICHILRMKGKKPEEKRNLLFGEYVGEGYIYYESEEIPVWKDGEWITNLLTGNKFKFGDFIV